MAKKAGKRIFGGDAIGSPSSNLGAEEAGPAQKKRRLEEEAADRTEGGNLGESTGTAEKRSAPLSLDERAAASQKVKKEMESCPSTLKTLAPVVEAQAKHVVHELGWEVDEIIQAVADKGLRKAYRDYATKYKRPWAKASKAEVRPHALIFGQKLLYHLKYNEELQLKTLRLNGYYDTNKMPCSGHVTREREVLEDVI